MKNNKITTTISIVAISLILLACNSQVQNSDNSINNKKKIENQNTNKSEIVKTTPTNHEIIDKLCSDEFNGRLTGSKGNDRCVKYLVDIFNVIGLEPFKDTFHHSYIQDPPEIFGENTIEENKNVYNVIGKIPGRNHKKAIFISAHFDHIGKRDNNIIRGAIDNASGITTLIQSAVLLKEYSNKKLFEYDIVFCAFNGEEEALQGSRSFVSDIKGVYTNSLNINIDSIGYIKGGDIIFLNRKSTYENLYKSLEKSLNNNGINVTTNKIKGFSDNKSFDTENIPNVCLIEEHVKEVIHTSKDIPELIDYNRINLIIKSIVEFVTDSGYKLLNIN